jgi:hypothetical protein
MLRWDLFPTCVCAVIRVEEYGSNNPFCEAFEAMGNVNDYPVVTMKVIDV